MVAVSLSEARTADGMTLAEIEREIPGDPVVEGDASLRVFGVQNDSRAVEPGDVFVVRKGATHDGRAFVDGALAKGAVALLAAKDLALDAKVPVLRVPNVADGLAYASAAVYGHPAFSLDVVGVTGTNGKTTTTHLVRAALDGAYGKPLCGVVGTVGHTFAGQTIEAAHTTPEADELARILAIMKKRGATAVAMEVSSIALVLRRVAAVRFRVAAFTNLTQDHLDFHGSMDAYAAAKMELFTTMKPGLGVVCTDGDFGKKIASTIKSKCLKVRTEIGAKDADVFPLAIDAKPSGMRILAHVPGGPKGGLELATRLVGMHNVENLLVAIGVVAALDLPLDRAAAALATEPGAPGRLERCDGPEDDIVVLVDYAHTPDALGRVLDTVRGVGKRVLCVFGCGGDRDPTKRRPMGEAVGKRANVAIITNDNPRTESPIAIAGPVEQGVRAGGLLPRNDRDGYVVELDRKRAIALAVELAEPGDVVLVAGKGHEDYQIIGHDKRPFDDRKEARAALTKRRGST
jgi:UDP-N-acetylmuramoyl-L-alanyl-D-glutamate--2,6-diaminopimelate ligase